MAIRKTNFWWKVSLGILATGTLSAADTPVPKGKALIEAPPKALVANSAPAPTAPASPENPTVSTGLVKWHATVEDAMKAAQKSRKPVLLFQMMGYLDKKFC